GVLWTEDQQNFTTSSSGTAQNGYYPSVMRLHYMSTVSSDPATIKDTVIASTVTNDNGNTFYFGDQTVPYPLGTQIKEGDDWIAYPTIARGSDPNLLTVLFQTFPANDSVQFNDTSYHVYASIYAVTSTDGGI